MPEKTEYSECLVCFGKNEKPICRSCLTWLKAMEHELVLYEMEMGLH